MCSNPPNLPMIGPVPCRHCKECRSERARAWIGRSIAESYTSKETWAITLTYGGGEHHRAALLEYSDVQKAFKRLRKAGFKFRYIVVGEYGTRKGRAHWHAILFWETEPPVMPDALPDGRVKGWRFWKDGHVFVDKLTNHDHVSRAICYCWKYLDKTTDDSIQSYMRCSLNAPIGWSYLASFVVKHVDQKLPLFATGRFYTIPGVRVSKGRNKGQLWQYWLTRNSSLARRAVQLYVEEWKTKHPDLDVPQTDCVREYEDGLVAGDPSLLDDRFLRHVAAKAPHNWQPNGLTVIECETTDRPGFVVSTDRDGSKFLRRIGDKGEKIWQARLAGVEDVAKAMIGTFQVPDRLELLRDSVAGMTMVQLMRSGDDFLRSTWRSPPFAGEKQTTGKQVTNTS